MSVASYSAAEYSPFPMRKFSVEEYHQLGRAGVLTERDSVELLEGWIVPKMNHNPAHDGTIELVEDNLRPRLPDGWRIRIQSTITTPDSEPEPDLAIVRGPAGRYVAEHPIQPDIAFVVEVAESSLSRDRDKRRLYARAMIAVFWIVNLVDRRVEVYTDPTGPDAAPAYRRREDFGPGQEVPVVIEGLLVGRLAVANLLP